MSKEESLRDPTGKLGEAIMVNAVPGINLFDREARTKANVIIAGDKVFAGIDEDDRSEVNSQ